MLNFITDKLNKKSLLKEKNKWLIKLKYNKEIKSQQFKFLKEIKIVFKNKLPIKKKKICLTLNGDQMMNVIDKYKSILIIKTLKCIKKFVKIILDKNHKKLKNKDRRKLEIKK